MEEEKELDIKPEKNKEITLDGERIFLSKSKFFGWSVIKPNKIDGKTNWKNLLIGGSWIRFWTVVIIIIIVLGCIYEYSQALTLANECLAKDRLIEKGIQNLKING